MAKVKLNTAIEWLSGRMGDWVYRRSHTGELSVVQSPDMSRVKWSPAQKEHRERFRQAVIYAKTAMADPEIRAIYVEMAAKMKKNKRPFDMAVSDYFQGNDLVWKKRISDRKQPESL